MRLQRGFKYAGFVGLILVMSMVIAACGSGNAVPTQAPGTLPGTGGNGITGTLPTTSTTTISPTTSISPTAPMTATGGVSATASMSPTASMSSTTGMSSTTSTSGTAATGTPIIVTAQNMKFDTNTITVKAGQEVTIQFTNNDSVPHNIAVYKDKTLAEKIYVGQIITGPNKTVTYTFTAPSTPGTYYFQCDVHPSLMNGEFIVQ